MKRTVDLRSDTVTRPSVEMREVMSRADVGDDVYGEDPSVQRLERTIAERLGHEAGVFVASGTMANTIAIALHTRPGDEVILDALAHPAHHEGGGPAANSGVTLRGVASTDGILTPSQIERAIRPARNYHAPSTLLCLENTVNAAGGRVWPVEAMRACADVARRHGLAIHLDGARLWNASIARDTPLEAWSRLADTASVCLSKGLGAPIGSVLCGSEERIALARRVRHRLGGGWRQAGVLAAAGLYAVEHHLSDLKNDHLRARSLASTVDSTGALRVTHVVESNIVLFDGTRATGGAEAFWRRLTDGGVLTHPPADGVMRFVTHRDFDDADLVRAEEVIRRAAGA